MVQNSKHSAAFKWSLMLPRPKLERCIGVLEFFARAILRDNSLNMISITYQVQKNVFFPRILKKHPNKKRDRQSMPLSCVTLETQWRHKTLPSHCGQLPRSEKERFLAYFWCSMLPWTKVFAWLKCSSARLSSWSHQNLLEINRKKMKYEHSWDELGKNRGCLVLFKNVKAKA